MTKQASTHKRKDISLRVIDQVVDTPASIRRFLKENPTIGVNEIFNVTPHSVEGMEWTTSMLQRACSKHLTESVRWLLDNGADPNTFRDDVEDINSIPPITLCILHAISAKSRAAAITNIKVLVKFGAHLNHETECSSFPLECAASIITPRSPRDTWDLSMCLVKLGAHTRHLAPNLFSAPPATLVKELKRLEKERQVSMRGALVFALQCTEVPRATSSRSPCTPMLAPTHPESLSAAQVTEPFAASRCDSPFRSLSQGPLSQMGLVPSTPPHSTCSQTLPTHAYSTPTPPKQHVHSPYTYSTPTSMRNTTALRKRHSPYVYSTPTAPKDLSRKRSFAQIPWAPILKHKAKRRRTEKVRAPLPPQLSHAPESPVGITEFATPKRSTEKSTSRRSMQTTSHSSTRKTHQPSHSSSVSPRVPVKRPSHSSITAACVQVSADVQRVILDFALPISHAPSRRARIHALMAMKTKRDRGQALSSWLGTGITRDTV